MYLMESSGSCVEAIEVGLIATPRVTPTVTDRVLLEDVKVLGPAVYK